MKNFLYIINISYGEIFSGKEQGLVLRADDRRKQAGSISGTVTLGKPFNFSVLLLMHH